MPKILYIEKDNEIELILSELSGALGMTRGEVIQAIADSQNKSRQAVYFWIKEIRSGGRPDVEVRFKAAVKKFKKERGV